ncbi:MAG: tyrosine protein phosphatase [Enterococcus lacertideformus]|uniref:Tyrosine-protein phosphatase n=1 Tax=Enterococcus lacertideformus TaxID=2771493 RepID=A0A931FBA1_9ENTE|nr:tyrosine protein phosphatase [Enterococcus lacertideformus]
MIDLHCHILPGVDDGPKNLEESLEIAIEASNQGVTHLMCTPHHNNGRFVNPAMKVKKEVSHLQSELDRRKIDLKLLVGQENRITGKLMEEIEKKEIVCFGKKNSFLLIEFPTNDVPLYAKKLLFRLVTQGYVPIIVHPERNKVFINDPNQLLPFLEMGAMTQGTAPSIVGIFGRKIQKTAKKMIQANLIQMIASDAHSLEKRNFYLKEAYSMIQKDFGEEKVNLLKKMPMDILYNNKIEQQAYKKVKNNLLHLFG